MFATFSRSWELVKASFDVLRSDRELILFPIISMIGTIIVTIVFMIPLFASGLLEAAASTTETGETALTQGQTIFGLVLAFLFYFTMYTVIIFSNVALVGAAMIRLEGGNPTLQDGFRIASERIGAILGYAAISATVGMILNAIRDEDNILSQILAGLLSTAWNLIVFLVIPILVVENVGPIEAIKRSGTMLKRTWGEQIAGSFSIGGVFFVITLVVGLLVGLPLIAIASAIGSTIVWVLAIGLLVVVIMAINLLGSALNGIFQAALYRYATEGEAGEFFQQETLAGAFHAK